MFMIKYFVIILFFVFFMLLFIKKANTLEYPKFIEQKDNKELLIVINEINENTSKINSLSYGSIKINLKKGLFFRAKAHLYFEKEKKIRIIIENIFGKQMDIGSNEELFWYWSRSMQNPAYYFSKHQNLNKTNLKTPLCPEWIIESFGFKTIDVKNITFIKSQNFQGIKQIRIDSAGQIIGIVTLFDPVKKIVVGRYLCNFNDEVIASVEYKDYTFIKGIKIPNHIVVHWHQENIMMEWNINEIDLNTTINNKLWSMPEGHAVDLSSN